MAYMYCSCGNALENPLPEEIIKCVIRCRDCGKEIGLCDDDKDDFIIEMHDRIATLEHTVARLVGENDEKTNR